MVNMVPHEAFACSCAEGDVVLRQSYKPKSYGKLYYACPKSKPPKHFGCGFFLWKETRLRQLMSSHGAPSAGPSTSPSYSSRPSTSPSYSSRPSTPTNYYLGSSRNGECSNCKHLRGKIKVLCFLSLDNLPRREVEIGNPLLEGSEGLEVLALSHTDFSDLFSVLLDAVNLLHMAKVLPVGIHLRQVLGLLGLDEARLPLDPNSFNF
ncbi:hypothetical protein Tco_0860831 [Tanacetum coccineum]|uniref:GRF-type domain-containing protein n=1 Tax=Tanacetum coccineum TaxID=301880 RepID=A0ABQ5BHT0_9ASTR